jgi:hypothetical protein
MKQPVALFGVGETGGVFAREALFAAMVNAFEGDLARKCKIRSAPARLARAFAHGDDLRLELPALRELRAVLV